MSALVSIVMSFENWGILSLTVCLIESISFLKLSMFFSFLISIPKVKLWYRYLSKSSTSFDFFIESIKNWCLFEVRINDGLGYLLPITTVRFLNGRELHTRISKHWRLVFEIRDVIRKLSENTFCNSWNIYV